MSTPRRVPLVALVRPDLLDGLRGRRQLLVRALTPVLLFVAVFAVALLGGDAGAARGEQHWTVAVQGDLAGARRTLARLGAQRIDFVPTDDAALAVTEDVDAAVRVPEGLDASMAAGAPAHLELVEVTVDADSRAAVAQLQAGIATLAGDDALRAAGVAADETVFTIELTEVELTERGTQVLGAQLVAAVVCLQAAMLVSGAANRFRGRRGGGQLVAQLALPTTRRQLALGKGLAELGVGTAASLPVLVPVVVLAVVVAAGEGGAGAAALVVPAVLAAAVVLGACATAVGVLVGVAARSPEQVTLGSGAAVVAAAIVAATVGLGELARPAALALVPVAGVVSEVRELVAGSPRPVALVVALLVTAAPAAAVSAASGRLLDGERLVVREA